jgi:hypothetical protein
MSDVLLPVVNVPAPTVVMTVAAAPLTPTAVHTVGLMPVQTLNCAAVVS